MARTATARTLKRLIVEREATRGLLIAFEGPDGSGGASCGLPEQWLRELLRFAPRPDVQGLARERKRDRT